MDAEEIIRSYRILEKTGNLLVIHFPPNRDGKLVESDVKKLMYIAGRVKIGRE